MSRSKKSSSTKSSENNLWQDNERPITRRASQSSSTKRTVYPNVPRRTRQLPLIDDEDVIDTESTIDVLPTRSVSQTAYGSSSNRHTLDLLLKYTSPNKQSQQTCSPPTDDENSVFDDFDFIYGMKSKRTLSPVNETSQPMSQSKRTRAFIEEDGNEEENELSCFLDHRYAKRVPSQTTTTTNQIEQKQPPKRKPTARNLKPNRSQTSVSQPILIEPSVDDIRIESCEPMIDHGEITFIDRVDTSCLPKPTALSTDRNHSIITSIDNQPKITISSTPIHSIKRISLRPTDRFSPSSNSLFFDTPNSSFSRLQINRTTSTPQIVPKTDCATEITCPTNIDMINQLISQINSTSNSIDFNPNELAKQLFYQTNSFSSTNKHRSMDLLPKKQILHINRYEIEILYPLENEKFSIIYICDTCLKTFYGSSFAFQRHTAKCLSSHPPGKIIYSKDDLTVFQIGQTNLTFEQRNYMKFLFQLRRLFIDNEKTIDDTKLNQFVYYILCRKDPILSAIQPPIYRFIGYFSKQINQSVQQMLNNLSCLFILPCWPQANDYNRFLISFSYFLNRSNASTNFIYCSPARPLDSRMFSILRNYWREMFLNYLIYHNHSSIKPLALDTFTRQTLIHPRDILFSLSTNGLLAVNPTDKSSIYLRMNAYSSFTRSNFDMKNEILFMTTDLIDENKISLNEQNTNKSHDSGIEEIILD